jgi:N-acetylmuramoyl-L-alanine amidase
VDAVQYDRIAGMVAAGVAEGAVCWQPAAALPAKGLFYPPTLLTEVAPSSTVAQQEIFGPVLVAMTFRTPAEAVELANNTVYGLAASVWSENVNVALDVAAQVKAGVVWVNATNVFDAACGFGGYRESGYGREGGAEGMFEYLEAGWVKDAPGVVAAPAHVSEARHGVPAPIVRQVPGAVAVKAPATTAEVASVSDAPGRVEATAAPTSRPIAATVAGEPPTVSVNLGTGAATSTGKRKKTKSADATVTADAAPAKAAEKTADGETSLVRALGLKINRIVIDAGHGGHDSGTLGAGGIEEKDVVLDVALRLGKLLSDRLGAQITFTRSDDTFVPLETRTAIANKAQADLFISVHANSSEDPSARGVETYYLNFTSDPAALDVAARENAVGGQSIHQLSDLVKKITLKDKIDESREFASDVESSLYAGLAKGNDGLKNRGVKKAPFVVLIGANMPSILAEISFVTNPRDADQLRQPEYRERVAESLYNGVARYESGLAGSKASVQRASIR